MKIIGKPAHCQQSMTSFINNIITTVRHNFLSRQTAEQKQWEGAAVSEIEHAI